VAEATIAGEFDVIVVGGGGSGLAAASEAARLGRSVLLLEKKPSLGGSTCWSVGSISVTCSPHQLRHGIQDSPQEHFEDLDLLNAANLDRDNRMLRRTLTDNTTDMLAWLSSTGLQFIGPMPEPPHRYPRMHNVVPNSRAYPYFLGRHCRKLGVDIRLDSPVERLIAEDGRISGIEVRSADGEARQFRARGGVVLAAGDYSANAEMKAELASPLAGRLDPVNPTATGDGHRMAVEHGAVLVNGDMLRGPALRFVPPMRRKLVQMLPPNRLLARTMRWSFENLPEWLLRPFMMSFLTTALGADPGLFREGAILVNADGRRFCDERDRPAHGVAEQRGNIAYILFDRKVAEKFSRWPNFISTAPGIAYAYLRDYRRTRRDICHRGATVEALAAKMGVPADALGQTVRDYNTGERNGRPALDGAPFEALGPVKAYVTFTDGSLQVNERLEVLDAAGDPIPGFFAAGSVGQGGMLLEGHGHHLGWAFISGRIAGRSAAFAVPPRARANIG
jgi:succinate dehydrogenase/fumarate reductase flavoprotein subunit